MAFAIGCGAAIAAPEERTWTRSEILAIADAEAKRLGYDIEQMSVSFDFYNTDWVSVDWEFEKLAGRDFFAVYYGPLREHLGGDLWVFVDRHTGEVITRVGGE